MPYTPALYHCRSIRMKDYDYWLRPIFNSQSGLYFVTICVQNRECLFGKITDGEMMLNDAGKMIEKWCAELSHKFPDIELDTYIIMPNHFHVIIVNNGVGADLRVCPNDKNRVCPDNANNVCPHETGVLGERDILGAHMGEHIGSPLHRVVQWFKTMTTNEYIRGVKTLDWQPFNKKI
jgi:hypothetical protein